MGVARPKSRPKITKPEVAAILAKHGIAKIDKCYLLGIRGYYKDSIGKVGQNDIDVYDDALAVISPTVFATFNFNTDPAKAGHKLAMLDAGSYDFYKGKHKGKYDALRPYPEGVRMPCTRDGVKSMCANTNIHKGGNTDTFSEGCQTTPPDQYSEEMKLIYGEMTRYKQATIRYTLIEA